MRFALALAGAVLAAAAAAAIYVYAGAYNIAADERHWRLTERLLETVRTRSIEVRARRLAVPADLDEEKRALAGAGQYAEMCAGCHLAPGVQNTPLRQGLYPRPPDFTRRGHDTEPRADFWVIKHGIKMTGMPAWGASHDDDSIWSLVAFLSRLPALDARAYRAMVRKAPGDEEMKPRGEKPSAARGGKGAHSGMPMK